MKISFKSILTTLSLVGFLNYSFCQTYSTDRNYVVEQIVKNSGYTSSSVLGSKPVDSVFNIIHYLDGLGRPSQTILQQWTYNTKKDLYTDTKIESPFFNKLKMGLDNAGLLPQDMIFKENK